MVSRQGVDSDVRRVRYCCALGKNISTTRRCSEHPRQAYCEAAKSRRAALMSSEMWSQDCRGDSRARVATRGESQQKELGGRRLTKHNDWPNFDDNLSHLGCLLNFQRAPFFPLGKKDRQKQEKQGTFVSQGSNCEASQRGQAAIGKRPCLCSRTSVSQSEVPWLPGRPIDQLKDTGTCDATTTIILLRPPFLQVIWLLGRDATLST
ncbi:hypothetical protein QBC43DRAFT_77865 [Cladorrhinum sp. PSN259]|nr:hypothetical protein QBC43DRAFT_77865 [Cladorrhinum sp. PSN259]